MNTNEFIEMFHESVSDFLKTEYDDDKLYYMGKAHAFTLVFNVLCKQGLINRDTLSQLEREWNDAFDEKYRITNKENEIIKE